MSIEFGLIFAFAAMLLWGVGDFLIQKSARKIGNWETLFAITLVGVVGLLPFVWRDIPQLFINPQKLLVPLLISAGILLVAAVLEIEALREGKLAVIEPIWSLEIPVAVVLSAFIIGEVLLPMQIVLIIALVIGLVLVSFRGGSIKAKHFLEKGVLIALLSAIFMGLADFYMGIGGRLTDSLLMNFVASFVILTVATIYILFRCRFTKMLGDFKNNKKLLLSTSILDNLAWIAFVLAMTLAPIGIVVAISESYIIIVVLFGLFVAKEKLKNHQKWGLVLALTAAIILAVYTV